MLDFDGVIHSYTSGWKGADVIPDPPVEGAFAAIAAYMEHFQVAIFSSRSTQEGGRRAMMDWFQQYGWPGILKADGFEPEGLSFPLEKGPAILSIDDRALRFEGLWWPVEVLQRFKPWNKQPVREDDCHQCNRPPIFCPVGCGFRGCALCLGWHLVDNSNEHGECIERRES